MRVPRLLLAFLAFPVLTSAQPAFQEKVTVSYVEVPVTVIGTGGGAVRGLTQANFEVFDDGEKRPIDSFEAIDFASERPLKTISPLHPASRRNFLLLFDLSFSSPNSIGKAQTAARSFIARSVGSRDLVAIGSLDVERGFRFLTAFTTDRELLVAAIADPLTFQTSDPLQIASGSPMREIGADGSSAGTGGRGDRSGTLDELAADFMRSTAKLDDAFNRGRVKRQVETLGSIARSMQGLAGRKHLVLLSEGFDPRLVQGRSVTESAEQTEENAAIQSGEIWKVDSDRRYGSANAQRSISLMASQFRRADVVLHAVDIQGVRVQNDVRGGAKVNSNEGLFLLANSTGGSVFRNSNDISAEFDRLTRQHEVVYVLGFRAPLGEPGQFHELKVRLVNVPNAHLQHRGGYYDAGNESVLERSLSTAEVIINDIPQDALGLAALSAAFPSAEGDAQVPVVLEVTGADLIAKSKDGAATTEFFVYAFDENGLVRGSLYQRMRLDVEKAGERLRESGVRFYGTLRLPPGRYAVKTLVRVAETDARGYRRVEVTVPEKGDVAMVRPLFFEEAGHWIMVKSANEAKVPYPFVLDGESFIPSARPKLRKGEPRLFTVFVYNAGPDELTWEIRPEAKLVSKTDGDDVTKYVFALERHAADIRELGVTIRKTGSADERRVVVPIEAQ